jgi:outer membrane autotransporter protein
VAVIPAAPSVETADTQMASDTVFQHLDAALSGEGVDEIDTAVAAATPIKLALNDSQVAQLSDANLNVAAALKRYGGWFRALGAFQSAHSQGPAPGYSGRSGGFLAGIDRSITSDLTLGIAGGYSHTDLSQSDGTSGTIETPRLLGYGLYRVGQLAFEATFGIGYDRISTARPVAALGASAVEGHNGFEKSAALQAAYPLAVADYTVVPRAGVQYTRLDETKFSESGAGGFDLASGGDTTESLQPSIGASVFKSITTETGVKITPELTARYARELLGTSRNLVLTSAAGAAVNAIGVSAAHNTVIVGSALTVRLDDALEFTGDYQLTLGLGKSTGHTVIAGARATF